MNRSERSRFERAFIAFAAAVHEPTDSVVLISTNSL